MNLLCPDCKAAQVPTFPPRWWSWRTWSLRLGPTDSRRRARPRSATLWYYPPPPLPFPLHIPLPYQRCATPRARSCSGSPPATQSRCPPPPTLPPTARPTVWRGQSRCPPPPPPPARAPRQLRSTCLGALRSSLLPVNSSVISPPPPPPPHPPRPKPYRRGRRGAGRDARGRRVGLGAVPSRARVPRSLRRHPRRPRRPRRRLPPPRAPAISNVTANGRAQQLYKQRAHTHQPARARASTDLCPAAGGAQAREAPGFRDRAGLVWVGSGQPPPPPPSPSY